MEISKTELNRYKGNLIHVSDIYYQNQLFHYDNVSYGANIKTDKKSCISNGNKIWWKEVNFENIKGFFFCITASKGEYKTIPPGLYITSTNNSNKVSNDSGILVLYLFKLDRRKPRLEVLGIEGI